VKDWLMFTPTGKSSHSSDSYVIGWVGQFSLGAQSQSNWFSLDAQPHNNLFSLDAQPHNNLVSLDAQPHNNLLSLDAQPHNNLFPHKAVTIILLPKCRPSAYHPESTAPAARQIHLERVRC
jgi:hypothetical protein